MTVSVMSHDIFKIFYFEQKRFSSHKFQSSFSVEIDLNSINTYSLDSLSACLSICNAHTWSIFVCIPLNQIV